MAGEGPVVALPNVSSDRLAFVAKMKPLYPNLDEHMLELIWDFDTSMRAKFGDKYDPSQVLNAKPLVEEPLRFYDGPQREEIEREEIITPGPTLLLDSVQEESEDEDCRIEEVVDQLDLLLESVTL